MCSAEKSDAASQREAIRILTEEHGLPIVRACQVARLSRAAYYKPVVNWTERDGRTHPVGFLEML